MNTILRPKPRRPKHVLLPLENQVVKITSGASATDWEIEYLPKSLGVELPTRSTTMLVPDSQVASGALRADPHLARSELPKRARLIACETLHCEDNQLYLDYQRITVNSIQWQAVSTQTINSLLPKGNHHILRRIVPTAHACRKALEWLLPSPTQKSTVCTFTPSQDDVLLTLIDFKQKSCQTCKTKPHLAMRKLAELPESTTLLWINPEMIAQEQTESPMRQMLVEALDIINLNNWHIVPSYQDVFGNGKQAHKKQQQDCAPWLPLLGAHLEHFTRGH